MSSFSKMKAETFTTDDGIGADDTILSNYGAGEYNSITVNDS